MNRRKFGIRFSLICENMCGHLKNKIFLGCLMSCAWKNPKCRIGLIIGTGTNACYLEEMDKVSSLDPTPKFRISG